MYYYWNFIIGVALRWPKKNDSFIKQFVVLIEKIYFKFLVQAVGNVFFDEACLVSHWGFSSRAKFENMIEFFQLRLVGRSFLFALYQV